MEKTSVFIKHNNYRHLGTYDNDSIASKSVASNLIINWNMTKWTSIRYESWKFSKNVKKALLSFSAKKV